MSEKLFYFDELSDDAKERAFDYLFESGYWKEELDCWRDEHVQEVLDFFNLLNFKADESLFVWDYGDYGYHPEGNLRMVMYARDGYLPQGELDSSCDLTQKYFGWDKVAGDPYDGEFHYWLTEDYVSPEYSEYGDCWIYDSLVKEWNEGIEPFLNEFVAISDEIRDIAERDGVVPTFYSDKYVWAWHEQVLLINLFGDLRKFVEKISDRAISLVNSASDGDYDWAWDDFRYETGNTFLYYEDGTIAVDEDGNYIRSEYY